MARASRSTTTEAVPTIASAWQAIEASEMKDVAVHPQILREVALALQANQRHSTANTKRRGEVSGGGRKPWRQKGTGRARAGSIRSPLWKGGGITFGPLKSKNYQQKLTANLRRQALLGALRLKIQAGKAGIANLDINTVKTKLVLQQLADAIVVAPVLIITSAPTLARSLRNITGVKIITPNRLNALDIMSVRRVVFLNNAYTDLKKKLGV